MPRGKQVAGWPQRDGSSPLSCFWLSTKLEAEELVLETASVCVELGRRELSPPCPSPEVLLDVLSQLQDVHRLLQGPFAQHGRSRSCAPGWQRQGVLTYSRGRSPFTCSSSARRKVGEALPAWLSASGRGQHSFTPPSPTKVGSKGFPQKG